MDPETGHVRVQPLDRRSRAGSCRPRSSAARAGPSPARAACSPSSRPWPPRASSSRRRTSRTCRRPARPSTSSSRSRSQTGRTSRQGCRRASGWIRSTRWRSSRPTRLLLPRRGVPVDRRHRAPQRHRTRRRLPMGPRPRRRPTLRPRSSSRPTVRVASMELTTRPRPHRHPRHRRRPRPDHRVARGPVDLVVPEVTGDVVAPAPAKIGKTFMAVPVTLPTHARSVSADDHPRTTRTVSPTTRRPRRDEAADRAGDR